MTSFLEKAWRKFDRIRDEAVLFRKHLALLREAAETRERFSLLAKSFADRFAAIQSPHNDVVPLWQSFTERLERSLLPEPPWNFLRDPVISSTMVMDKRGSNMRAELAFLQSFWTEPILRKILREDPAGRPRIIEAKFLASHNSIHHAHHIARFLQKTSTDLNGIGTVVEWGGGYGNLAKLWRRLAVKPPTWLIIDLPILSTMQWLYLSSVIGAEHVRLITGPGQNILANGITLIPSHLMNAYPLTCDLFVSTWALSESPASIQQEVFRRKWFGGRHLLLGYQNSNPELPAADGVGKTASASGATIHEIPGLPGNYYAFK